MGRAGFLHPFLARKEQLSLKCNNGRKEQRGVEEGNAMKTLLSRAYLFLSLSLLQGSLFVVGVFTRYFRCTYMFVTSLYIFTILCTTRFVYNTALSFECVRNIEIGTRVFSKSLKQVDSDRSGVREGRS